jgi:CO/xanthine dehydrogenase FAD-binding subunit
MTRSSPARRERRRLERKGRGRPRGSSIPLARDRQRFAIAIWWALYKFGYGPYQAAHLAAVVVQNEPIRLEDVESLLIVASSKIRFTASSLEEHVAWLARKAKRRGLHSRSDYFHPR